MTLKPYAQDSLASGGNPAGGGSRGIVASDFVFGGFERTTNTLTDRILQDREEPFAANKQLKEVKIVIRRDERQRIVAVEVRYGAGRFTPGKRQLLLSDVVYQPASDVIQELTVHWHESVAASVAVHDMYYVSGWQAVEKPPVSKQFHFGYCGNGRYRRTLYNVSGNSKPYGMVSALKIDAQTGNISWIRNKYGRTRTITWSERVQEMCRTTAAPVKRKRIRRRARMFPGYNSSSRLVALDRDGMTAEYGYFGRGWDYIYHLPRWKSNIMICLGNLEELHADLAEGRDLFSDQLPAIFPERKKVADLLQTLADRMKPLLPGTRVKTLLQKIQGKKVYSAVVQPQYSRVGAMRLLVQTACTMVNQAAHLLKRISGHRAGQCF